MWRDLKINPKVTKHPLHGYCINFCQKLTSFSDSEWEIKRKNTTLQRQDRNKDFAVSQRQKLMEVIYDHDHDRRLIELVEPWEEATRCQHWTCQEGQLICVVLFSLQPPLRRTFKGCIICSMVNRACALLLRWTKMVSWDLDSVYAYMTWIKIISFLAQIPCDACAILYIW